MQMEKHACIYGDTFRAQIIFFMLKRSSVHLEGNIAHQDKK